MRFFNTEGPVRPDKHYCVPPLARLDLDRILTFIGREKYFVLRVPRQTGKTSALLALRDLLDAGSTGGYRCVYANIEVGQWAREDVEAAMRSILGGLASRARRTLGDDSVEEMWPSLLAKYGLGAALGETLSRWAEADSRPLVLLLDEIDTLVGDTLIAVLRQLRAGYDLRPESFPQSVILCGVRDVRDLGLIARDDPPRIANPVYAEVVPRELTYTTEAGLVQRVVSPVLPGSLYRLRSHRTGYGRSSALRALAKGSISTRGSSGESTNPRCR